MIFGHNVLQCSTYEPIELDFQFALFKYNYQSKLHLMCPLVKVVI